MIFRILSSLSLLCLLLAAPLATPLAAQDREVPYWASIRTEELNMRVGPSIQFPISWVYKREGLPVKVIRLVEGWRLIEDVDGTKGWVTASLLSKHRTALVVGEGLAAMRESSNANSKLRWNLEPGVVGGLGNCRAGWCELDVKGHKGWVEKRRLWGPDA